MAKIITPAAKRQSTIKKLNFLIGKWHTQGKILQGATEASNEIRGMDTYEWIAGGFFILHRVDVFMGNERTEVVEIIGYDETKKSYFMQSFDNQGESPIMYALLDKPGVLKLGDKKMRSTLTANRKGNIMTAKWELSEDGKTWKPWMDMKLSK